MKFTFFTSICFILTTAFAALAAESNLRLAGIVNLPGCKRAILDDSKHPEGYFLGEGERDGEIEVKAISAADLTVTLARHADPDLKLTMDTKQFTGATPSITLEKANFRSVVSIFQILCHRALLEHPQTPNSPFTLRSSATNREDALHDLQIAFTNKGIIMIPDGEKFLMIGPGSAAAVLIPRSAEVKSVGTISNLQSTNTENQAEELIPAGTLDFRRADLNSVFDVYGMLIGHRLNRSHGIPGRGQLYFLNQIPISKAEAVYVIGTLISWREVNVVTQSDGTITGVPR